LNNNSREIPIHEVCVSSIYEMSGAKIEPNIADLWIRILNHKCLLSEKVGRDLGLRTACVDFLENIDQGPDEHNTFKEKDVLKEMWLKGGWASNRRERLKRREGIK
jgi:transitional endoplasmic reticulum ATPase